MPALEEKGWQRGATARFVENDMHVDTKLFAFDVYAAILFFVTVFSTVQPAVAVATVKKASVYLDGPQHQFYGDVQIEENIATGNVQCQFDINSYYNKSTTRYKISFFPFIQPMLQSTVESAELPFGEVMFTIFNNTIDTDTSNRKSFSAPTFSNTQASLSRGSSTYGNSVVGRTLAVETCETRLNTYLNAYEEYCLVVASGVVGISSVNATVENNLARGHLLPWEKTLACFLFDGLDASSMQERTYGTILMRRRNDEKYVYETWARMSNIPYAGSTHALRLQTVGDLTLNKLGDVYDLKGHDGMPGFPCATKRRVGDMGDIQSTPGGDAAYRSIFELPTDFTDLLGRSCVLYRKGGSTCEAWDEGCSNSNINNEVLARGILGLAASSTSLSIRKIPDYDCTSLVKAYAHAKLVPFADSSATISGHVDFFAPESERSSSGVSYTSLQLRMSGFSVGTMVNHGIGILRYGEVLRGPLSRIPSNDISDASKFDRFDPMSIVTHDVPPNVRRVGDLGNIKPQNVTSLSYVVEHLISYPIDGDRVSIQNQLTSILGRTFVVYQNRDQGSQNQPNGNVGLPLAWGIIGTQLIPPHASDPEQRRTQVVQNVATGATNNDDTKHLVAELIPENGGTVIGMAELDIVYGNTSRAGAQIFQAYGHFKNVAAGVPYQWLILKSGLKVLDTESVVATPNNVLVENSLFPAGKKVPKCVTSVPPEDLKKYTESLKKIGNFGIFSLENNSTSNDVHKTWEKETSLSTLGAFAGLTVVLVRLDPDGVAQPAVVASGVLGIANYPALSTPQEKRTSTSSYLACNDVASIPKVYDGAPTDTLVFTEEVIALLLGLGITLFVVSFSAGVFVILYGKKKTKQLSREGPVPAISIDDGPPPPPLPKKDSTANDMEKQGYFTVANPLIQMEENRAKTNEVEMTSLRKRTRTLNKTGLPVHPSKKNLMMGKSFYNPRKLEHARSVHKMNKAMSQSVLKLPNHKHGPTTYLERIRSIGKMSNTDVGVDSHGRSYISLPTATGGSRIAKIGPPTKRASRRLPTHPSMLNVRKVNLPAAPNNDQRRRRSTRRHSEVETLVGWDQLNIGVRTSVVGKFVDEDVLTGLQDEFSDSDLE